MDSTVEETKPVHDIGSDDSLIAQRNRSQFEEAEKSTGHEDYLRNSAVCSKYYSGDQWNAEDKAELDEEGRPALTLNMMLSTINAMVGEQLERKVDITFTASRTGTEETAHALNAITKAILNENDFNDTEERVFTEGIITDRGFYDVRMCFENNLQGDVKITCEDGVDIIIDPEAKDSDPSTWNRVWISRWLTPDEIAERYGEDKLEQVLAYCAYGDTTGQSTHIEFADRTFGKDNCYTTDTEGETRAVRRLRVIECQHYKYTDVLKFVDTSTGDMRQVPYGVSKEQAEEFAEDNGYGVVEMKGRRLRMTTSVCDVLLYDDWSMYRTFTIVPFFPYFTKGKPHGVARHILDPQDLLNKTSSQELHIVNTTANSGWKMQEDSLVDMDADELEKSGSKTGLVLTYKRGFEPPEKIQPNQIPTGIERISQKAAMTIREVSAINASMLGTARADQSGKAQQQATMRGQVQVSVVLAALRRSRKLVARKVLELIQDFYTETRYFKTTSEGIVTSAETDGDVAINEIADDGSILNDVTVGSYGIHIGHAPSTGSATQAEFEEALRLREMNVNVPDHFIIKYSNLRERNDVAEYVKNLNGLGEKSQEQQALEQAQMEFEMASMQKDLELKDAEIDNKVAMAEQAKAKADTLEGYKQAEMEIARLQLERDKMRHDAMLRVSLAARSHVNAQNLSDSRNASQLAMKTMDVLNKPQEKPPKKDKESK